MIRPISLLLTFAIGSLFPVAAQDGGEVVFRSDVSLTRVDAQVVDRDNRAITGLRVEDFVLREDGRPREIRNFARENMPVDVLLLLDVSGSMQSHVQRIGSAAHQALQVLGDNDRVAIMVFDRSTRLRLPFRNSRGDVERELEALLRQETFNGGTDITRALLDAARYVGREGRREARRAIVILTDDQTERDRNEAAVSRALDNANAILSLLLAPDAMQNRQNRMPGMGRGRQGRGGWPSSGGGLGGPLGGIIFGPGGPLGGGMPGGGPVTVGSRTHSAGTAEIARSSGGDSMPVDDASALETTLARIRQRYALHFYLPDGVKPGQERNIEVTLSDAARRRYPDADVHFRRVNLTSGGISDTADPSPDRNSEPTVITRAPSEPAGNGTDPNDDKRPVLRRRPAVDGTRPDGPAVSVATPAEPSGGFRRADDPASAPTDAERHDPAGRGWRRLKPGEQP